MPFCSELAAANGKTSSRQSVTKSESERVMHIGGLMRVTLPARPRLRVVGNAQATAAAATESASMPLLTAGCEFTLEWKPRKVLT